MINRRELFKALAGTCAVAGISEVKIAEALEKEDVIVFKTDQYLSAANMERLAGSAKQLFPNQKIVVLDGGMDMEVLRLSAGTQADFDSRVLEALKRARRRGLQI